MAVLEEGIYTYLSTYAGLVALISARVYPHRFPQGATLPCLTYQRISTPRELTHDTSGIGSDLAHPRFQFDAWASTEKAAKAISDQVRTALNGKRGSIGGGITINAAMVEDERPMYEAEINLYRVSSDFIIWHND